MHPTVVVVGCGNMGRALLAGWRAQGIPAASLHVVEPDPERADAARRQFGVSAVASADGLGEEVSIDVVVLAVKPQVIAAVLPQYRRHAAKGALVVSIAAGTPIAAIAAAVGGGAVVRAMPNTPAAVRAGITVACANAGTTPAQRALAESLLSAVGDVAWIEDETLIDAVTAVSGSGPAYVFLLAECLAHAGQSAGLPADLAHRLARMTIVGAGRLLEHSPDPPARLRQTVTSPGGTTEAALAVLMADDGLGRLLEAAVRRAAARSRELSALAAPAVSP